MSTLRKVLIAYAAVSLIGVPIVYAQSPVLFSRADYPALNQSTIIKNIEILSESAQKFSLDFLEKLSNTLYEQNIHRDIMISPFTIWSLLLLLLEGADGNTLKELRTALHVEGDIRELRQAFGVVQKFLKANTSTIEVASLQAIFTDINQPVERDYSFILQNYYGSQLSAVDFHDLKSAHKIINDEVRKATRGLIPYAILPQDLQDTILFLISSLYFKGQWKLPFEKANTRKEPFFNEAGNPAGEVDMMVQEANFNYTGITELKAHVLELPYGNQNRLSMLIILPRKGVTLNTVVQNLKQFGIAAIFQRLKADSVGFEDENVEVLLPKFSTVTNLSLTRILQEMGINDIFDDKFANLSKMSSNLFVSFVVHMTKIIVNEEGTEAAAATSAVLANKATPPKFHLNRPFLYLILEKTTNILLFVGQVTNPNNL